MLLGEFFKTLIKRSNSTDHRWCLPCKSVITSLKIVWSELEMMAVNNCKTKFVGLHRTCARSPTLQLSNLNKCYAVCFTAACIRPVTGRHFLLPSQLAPTVVTLRGLFLRWHCTRLLWAFLKRQHVLFAVGPLWFDCDKRCNARLYKVSAMWANFP